MMKIETLCEKIGLQREVYDRVMAYFQEADFDALAPLAKELTGLDTSRNAYTELARKLGEDDTAMLACNLYAAVHVQERYREMGISEQVYVDTMKCFPRFLEETHRNSALWKFDRAFWTYRQLRMSLFRIGELEYEILPEEQAISLHIPSDARFDPEAVEASLEQAKDFFERFFPECRGYAYICESWLLSPELGKLLKQESNILRFQCRFEIEKTFPEDKEFLQWVFGADEHTPIPSLPEKTSMQRSVKALLLAGGNIGAALGKMKGTQNTT